MGLNLNLWKKLRVRHARRAYIRAAKVRMEYVAYRYYNQGQAAFKKKMHTDPSYSEKSTLLETIQTIQDYMMRSPKEGPSYPKYHRLLLWYDNIVREDLEMADVMFWDAGEHLKLEPWYNADLEDIKDYVMTGDGEPTGVEIDEWGREVW